MDELQSLRYAQARLALAKLVNDNPEIDKWLEQVNYWKYLINRKCNDSLLQFDIWISQGLCKSDLE